ncbi:MAG: DegT/DnrJ/EryC1/StrS family aminotransferase [Myxococcota bacterium]|nr:DegT/DnrJ/EryC1/StrS family aminotransferase [Myxococcota bacterium]
MTLVPMLDLVRLHAPIAEALKQVLAHTLASGRFILGPAVEQFEADLAAHVGCKFAVGVSSGTDALLAGMMALDVRPGDEIITTPYTFFSTAGCIARLGARPVFADIDPVTFNIDPAGIGAVITDRTVGIIPVHLFGQCADMDPILEIAEARGLWVLEDAAQALGATYKRYKAGSLGRLSALSFFPAKNLGALGDAGAVLTNNAALAKKIQMLRQHGSQTKYCHDLVGGNFRLDALQAGWLSAKLPHVLDWEAGRRSVAQRYRAGLGIVDGLVLPQEVPQQRHVFNQYVIRIKTPKRDRVRQALTQNGIGCAVYYPHPLHLQPCFAHLGYNRGDFPESERAAEEALALPMDPLLGETAQERVIHTVIQALT